jgi:2-polyprenyl-3-methyl-5-hydroxy-6-metoxy-1,4-benzoquinol methylase
MPQPTVSCHYCGGESWYRLSSRDVNRNTVEDSFDYYRCSSCDLMFIHPIPPDLRPFYRGGYQRIPKDLAGLRTIAKAEHYRIEPILKYKSQGNLLEIGPWMGIFGCNAKDAGFNVTAIEIDSECVSFLNNIVGVEAIPSADPAAAMRALGRKFDVIALWHSLEHLPDPWNVLQAAAEHLAPQGILLVAVPNIESYDFAAMKARWLHLDAPRHLYFYTAHWLEQVCLANGLKTLEITTSDRLGQILSRNAWGARAGRIIPIKYFRWALGAAMYRVVKRRIGINTSGLTAIFAKP